jgi:Rieske Fe-S protein
MTTPEPARTLPRRQVLLTGGVVVAAAAVTTACSSSPSGSSSPAATSGTASSAPAPTVAAASATPSGTVVPASSVPVGGGVVIQTGPVVVTQPQAGQFKAFSAICTHQGCTVAGVQDGVIVCPCHGSTFSISDGSVQGGPAPSALPAVKVTVSGANVVVAT